SAFNPIIRIRDTPAQATTARGQVKVCPRDGITTEMIMTRTRQLVAASLLLLLLLPLAVAAQVTSSTSSVTGEVTDPNGAVVSGATVVLKDTRTSKEVTTTTDEQGVYRFAQVRPGQGYTITVTAAGFQTFTLSDVALSVGNVETHNVQLKAGHVP